MEKTLYEKFVQYGLAVVMVVYVQCARLMNMVSVNVPQTLQTLLILVGLIGGGLVLIRAYQSALAKGWKDIAEMREARVRELEGDVAVLKSRLSEVENDRATIKSNYDQLAGLNMGLQRQNHDLDEKYNAAMQRLSGLEMMLQKAGLSVSIPHIEGATNGL